MAKPNTTKLTIRLPRKQIEFVKRFAAANGVTVTEVISRYLEQLQANTPEELSPEVQRVVGLIPKDVDIDKILKEDRFEYLVRKHFK